MYKKNKIREVVKMVHRDRKRVDLTLSDETRKILSEMQMNCGLPVSRIIDELVEKFNEKTLPFVNKMRKKLGKEPLKK